MDFEFCFLFLCLFFLLFSQISIQNGNYYGKKAAQNELLVISTCVLAAFLCLTSYFSMRWRFIFYLTFVTWCVDNKLWFAVKTWMVFIFKTLAFILHFLIVFIRECINTIDYPAWPDVLLLLSQFILLVCRSVVLAA